MKGVVLIDSALLALLVVGATSRSYIEVHKNTRDKFDADDLDILTLLLKDFAEILLTAHVVAETSSLVRQIGDPRRTEIQRVFTARLAELRDTGVKHRRIAQSRESRAWGY